MRFFSTLHRAAAAAAIVAAAACGSEPTAPPLAERTSIRLVSDFGDFVGNGRTYEYSTEDAIIDVSASGTLLVVAIEGDERWRGEFQLPATSSQLQPGTYDGLTRYPFNGATGGLSWYGEGRGCNVVTGSVTIEAVSYNLGALQKLDMRFVQHCEGGSAALRGTIRWRADDKGPTPAPVTPVPTTLWQPPAGTTPASGDYVYLRSEPGDYIGGGSTVLYTESTTPITVSTATGRATVEVDGWTGWTGIFQAMNGLPNLQVGYYPDISRFPFHNTRKGGMSWTGYGRGCNTLSGWFAVDAITYSGTSIMSLDLRFEQRCEGGTAALRGKIRWRA